MTFDITLGDVIMIAIQIGSFAYLFGVHNTKITHLEKNQDVMIVDIKTLMKRKAI